MIKYFCNICGQEIKADYMHVMEISEGIMSKYRPEEASMRTYHMHDQCLADMLEYLERCENR